MAATAVVMVEIVVACGEGIEGGGGEGDGDRGHRGVKRIVVGGVAEGIMQEQAELMLEGWVVAREPGREWGVALLEHRRLKSHGGVGSGDGVDDGGGLGDDDGVRSHGWDYDDRGEGRDWSSDGGLIVAGAEGAGAGAVAGISQVSQQAVRIVVGSVFQGSNMHG
jgi:hypothetical protein